MNQDDRDIVDKGYARQLMRLFEVFFEASVGSDSARAQAEKRFQRGVVNLKVARNHAKTLLTQLPESPHD